MLLLGSVETCAFSLLIIFYHLWISRSHFSLGYKLTNKNIYNPNIHHSGWHMSLFNKVSEVEWVMHDLYLNFTIVDKIHFT